MELIVSKLQQELKKRAKAKDLNYSQIAKLLDISEATVKRLFNHEDISFSKLSELCSVLEIEFFELIDLIRDEEQRVYQFTMDQELLLSKSELNFKIFRSMLAGKSYEQLKELFSLKDKELFPLLNQFEKCGLIRLGVGNKLKVLATFPFKWKEDGPLEKKFSKTILEKIKNESLRIGVNQRRGMEQCSVFEWALTQQRHEQFIREINQVYTKYRTYAEIDIRSLEGDFIPCTGIISIGRYALW